jgi:hypothetical protein
VWFGTDCRDVWGNLRLQALEAMIFVEYLIISLGKSIVVHILIKLADVIDFEILYLVYKSSSGPVLSHFDPSQYSHTQFSLSKFYDWIFQTLCCLQVVIL